MATLYTHVFRTTLGQIHTAATERALALVTLPNQSKEDFRGLVSRLFPGIETREGGEINVEAESQICSFLTGNLKKFRLPLEYYGSDFQRDVLKAVAAIPYGQVRSYGEIARQVGHPRAFRAVGSVNAQNRLPLVIPCHRVVATTGLGGYGGGLKMKIRLLSMEGAMERLPQKC